VFLLFRLFSLRPNRYDPITTSCILFKFFLFVSVFFVCSDPRIEAMFIGSTLVAWVPIPLPYRFSFPYYGQFRRTFFDFQPGSVQYICPWMFSSTRGLSLTFFFNQRACGLPAPQFFFFSPFARVSYIPILFDFSFG